MSPKPCAFYESTNLFSPAGRSAWRCEVWRSSPLYCRIGRPQKLLVVTSTKDVATAQFPQPRRCWRIGPRRAAPSPWIYVRTDDEMAQKMTAESLKNYDGVIFANTTGELPLPDKEAFMEWLKSGKAFIGMHSAADTFPSLPPYREMLGAESRPTTPRRRWTASTRIQAT